jgi:hypothetical protein
MSGIGVDNKLKFLRSYGMIAVELRGAQGEKLALAKGKVAEFKLPNLSGESTPSEEIPLWHFDIVEGVWKEKGKAILDGSNYKAYVSHFSFWSIDAPADAVELSMHFQDVSQTPAAFQRVRISEVSNDSSYVIVYTDSLGGIKTWVPKDKELMVKMFNSCPMLIYEGRIAPLTGNKDLGIVSTTEVVNVTAKVQGSISDCNGMPLKNGYAEIIINGNTRRAALDADGRFSLTVDVCQSGSASAYITGVDLDKKQQSLESQLIQISGGNTYTATPMVACGTSSEEYLRVTVNGIVTEFKAPGDRFFALWGVSVSGSNDTLTVIEAYNSNFSKHLMFAFLGKPVANIVHPNFDFDLDIEPNHFVGAAYREFDVSVTEYGSIGQYIAGHFSTNMYDKLYEKMVPVIGEFRIKRISYNGRTSRPIQGNK